MDIFMSGKDKSQPEVVTAVILNERDPFMRIKKNTVPVFNLDIGKGVGT